MIKRAVGILLVLCGIAFTVFVLTFDAFEGDQNRIFMVISGAGLCMAGFLLCTNFRKA